MLNEIKNDNKLLITEDKVKKKAILSNSLFKNTIK